MGWVRDGCGHIGVHTRDRGSDWELRLPRPLPSISTEDLTTHIASLGKDPNSKPEVQCLLTAYRFRSIVKSVNPTRDHRKSGLFRHEHSIFGKGIPKE